MAGPDSILLASGGMDSTTLAYWLLQRQIEFVPVFVNYGQHCADTEYTTLCQVAPESCRGNIEVVDVSSVYRESTSSLIVEPDLWKDDMQGDPLYLPYRNLLIMTVGAAYAQSKGCTHLYAAFINSNHAKEIDCSARFFQELEGMLSQYGSIKVEMPFRDMSKSEVARVGIRLKAPIGATFSCQASSRIPCGACPNCVDRLEALRALDQDAEG